MPLRFFIFKSVDRKENTEGNEYNDGRCETDPTNKDCQIVKLPLEWRNMLVFLIVMCHDSRVIVAQETRTDVPFLRAGTKLMEGVGKMLVT